MASDIIARGIAAKAAADLEQFKGETAEALAGKADLVNGKVPSDQLPSYVDDVVEYADYDSFPEEGELGKIYVALDTGYTYRWSGSEYIQVGGQDLSVLVANFAALYDPASTYEAGDLCIYEDALYSCKEDIDPAEAWDASHWDRTDLATVIESAVDSLEAEIATKQDILVSGTNIKTINGKDVLGSGNMEIEANRPIPNAWNISSTTAALCESIVNDASAVKGMVYLGKIHCSDLPGHLVQGEAIISIISSGDANGKDIRIILTSANTSPYHWEYEYVMINGVYGSPAGWVGYQPELVSGVNIKTVAGKGLLGSGNVALEKGDVGLGNVDNTSDLDKPISTATQNALNLKADLSALQAHEADVSNPHAVTKSQVGLGNVDNTSDLDKPISNAVQAALDTKVNESDTTNFVMGTSQVSGAPMLGSITIGPDEYNIPMKTSDLTNDSGLLFIDDESDTAMVVLSAADWTVLKYDHYIKKSGTVFPEAEESRYKVTISNVDHVVRFALNSPTQAKAMFMVEESDGSDIYYYELTLFVVKDGNAQTHVVMRCATVMSEPGL